MAEKKNERSELNLENSPGEDATRVTDGSLKYNMNNPALRHPRFKFALTGRHLNDRTLRLKPSTA